MINIIDSTLQIAFLYAIPALAIMVAFRVIGFPDLTPDGSFTFGASIGAILLLAGHSTLISVLAAVTFGSLAGILTAIIHTKLGISKLLSGILIMLMLYSLSLRTMGTSNLSLIKVDTQLGSLINQHNMIPLISSFFMCFFLGLLIYMFLSTNVGLKLRSVGDSKTALEYWGISRNRLYIIGLALTNGLAGGAGVVISQYQGFVDVTMGSGLVITSLTAMIMGESIIKPEKVVTLVLSTIVGMIIYQSIIAIALRMGLAAADLRIATATLAITFIVLDRLRNQKGTVRRQIGNRNF